jgi:hypothetical protein
VAEQADGHQAKKAVEFVAWVDSREAERERQRRQKEENVAAERRRRELILDGSDSRQRRYLAPRERVFGAVLRAVGELSYTITHSDRASGVVSFNTGISLRSWGGQNATATVEALSAETSRVVVGGRASQAGNPFSGGGGQIYTFGELKSVAGKFFRKVEAILIEEETVAVPDRDELVDRQSEEVEWWLCWQSASSAATASTCMTRTCCRVAGSPTGMSTNVS